MGFRFIQFFFSFLLFGSLAWAKESPFDTLTKYRSIYPKETGIIVEDKRRTVIDLVNDSLQINTEIYWEILVLDYPFQWVKGSVYTSYFSNVNELKAYSLIPEKKKYKRVDVEEFKRKYDNDSHIFFDDSEMIKYNYPQLVEGSKIVKEYTFTSRDPRILNTHFFSNYVPVLRSKYEIVVHPNVDINHGYTNDTLGKPEFTKSTDEEGNTVYTYEYSNCPVITKENNGLGFGYLSQGVYLTISGFRRSNGEYKKVLSGLDDMHEWYSTLIDTLKVDPSLKEFSSEIVGAETDPYEKIKKIFYWVQRNVRYIAFEDGMRGLIPHEADFVLNKRYGDCKDMSSLLVGLLRSQGIPAYYTWIGTRSLPYRYSKMASPMVDNHMIATVIFDSTYLFLDATGKYTPLGFPTDMIQGKECFINMGEDYKIEVVPTMEKEKNLMIDTTYLEIMDGSIIGTGQLKMLGYEKVEKSYYLVQDKAREEEKYVKRLLSRGSNKFILDSYEVHNVDSFEKPIYVDYAFNISDYHSEVDDEIYINLCLNKVLLSWEFEDRKTPYENDFKFLFQAVYVLDIPEGYSVSYLPEGGSVDSKNLGFEIDYVLDGNRIYTLFKYYFDFLLLYPNEFNAWNDVIREYSKVSRNSVVLKKN